MHGEVWIPSLLCVGTPPAICLLNLAGCGTTYKINNYIRIEYFTILNFLVDIFTFCRENDCWISICFECVCCILLWRGQHADHARLREPRQEKKQNRHTKIQQKHSKRIGIQQSVSQQKFPTR